VFCDQYGGDCPAEAIKDTLFQSLFGIFIAITMIGRVIWKAIAADSGMTTHEETTAPILEAE